MTAHVPPIHLYQDEIVGSWIGTLTVPGAELRIVFHITEGEDGTLSATMDSPDQGATGITVSEVTFADGHLKLVSAAERVIVVIRSGDGDRRPDPPS